MTTRYDLKTPREGKDGKTYWTKIGSAWPTRAGGSFSLSFEALPIPNKEGEVRVVMSPPFDRDAPRPANDWDNARNVAPRAADDIPF